MEEAGLARVHLDLATQTSDLDVDGALAGLVHAKGIGDVLARQDLVGLAGQGGEQRGFAAGGAHAPSRAGEFATLGIEAEGAELARALRRFWRRRRGAAEQGSDAED